MLPRESVGIARMSTMESFSHHRWNSTFLENCNCSKATMKESLSQRRWKSTAIEDYSSHSIPFLLADIGEGIAEVELLQWFVQEGDQVQQFDRICEVQSDKATVEITSRYDGIITSLEHKKGEMVKVGSPLLFLESEEEDYGDSNSGDSSSLHTASTQSEPLEYDEQLHIPTVASQFHVSTDDDEASSSVSAASSSAKVQTTPAIRKIAKEHGLDLSTVVGSGPKGRVLKGDVLTVLKERGLVNSATQGAVAATGTTTASTISPQATPASGIPTTDGQDSITSIDQAKLPLDQNTTLDIRGYNRLMISSMTASMSARLCSASVSSLRDEAIKRPSEATMIGPPRLSSVWFIFSRKRSE